jgi:transitional endoplasmic reticulum ATPase
LYTLSGEPRLVQVTETDPAGIVIADADTEFQIGEGELTEFAVRYGDIGGLDREIRLVREVAEYPLRFPELFEHLGVAQPRGLILHGPPGTGKTLIAKAVAHECGANFIVVRGPEIVSKWVGESEQRLRAIFRRAREVAPCVIFFDEIDAIAPRRGRQTSEYTDSIVNQLLTEMDGMEASRAMFVLAATNRAELLDPALLRSGRFDFQVEVPLPDAATRASIFKVHLANKPVADDLEIDELVNASEGLSGADLAAACREAGMKALRGAQWNPDLVQVTQSHVLEALREIRATAANPNKAGKIGFNAGKLEGG